jgi:hypothetical protein
LRLETDHSPPSDAEVKNAWRYTSTPQYVFMACFIELFLINKAHALHVAVLKSSVNWLLIAGGGDVNLKWTSPGVCVHGISTP